ncbi:MAG: hypothetical protein AAF639_24240 [Chloroflexota bacterium]
MYCIELTFGRNSIDGTQFPVGKIQNITARILNEFITHFNGARVYSGGGSYKTQNGQVVLGDSTTVYSYTKTIDAARPSLALLAHEIGRELEEASTLLTITELKEEIHKGKPNPLCLLCQ